MGKHPILKKTSRERTARTIALVNEGAIHMQQNRLPDAEQCFRSALLLSPQIPEVHNNLGSALREQGRIEEAQHAFISALKLRPRYASAHSNLLFTRHYASGLTLQELRMAHENWATQQLASIAVKRN